MRFQATVNGKPVDLEIGEDRTLLDVLREDLGLTGAKKACDIGTCGCCNVLIDGKFALSCLSKPARLQGKEITTIEGLASEEKLHPLQEGFIQGHGFQCGICTSGFIMSAKALLDRHPKPTEEQIRKAIHHNICRCTGYQQLVESIQLASGQITREELGKGKFRIAKIADPDATPLPWSGKPLRIIGKDAPRIESVSRVNGTAKYTADIQIPGALWGATVRSSHTHARILGIETEKAGALPGVHVVLTAEDIPGENAYGKRIRDQQVFAKDRVRYYGEPIALVVADTREIAEKARDLVEVSYDPLPAVYDPEEAMKDGAPRVHEKGNILSHYHIEKGDVEKGFSEADVIVEESYKTQPQDHAPLEPEAAIAYYDEKGKLTVISPGQSVFFDRLNIIRALGIPKEDVRCIQAAIGAAYGKREDIYAQIHAALGAFITGKPVKIEYTREETMLVTTKRTQLRTGIRMGVRKTGEIVALEARVVGDSGAYASWSQNIMRKAGVLVSGPYEIPNVRVDSFAVYTNNPITGATRGFGAAETAFCSESHMDVAARALNMDPMEFRLKNVLKRGRRTATDFQLNYLVPAEATIREAARDFRWEERRKEQKEIAPDVRRGVGMATIWYGIGFGSGIEDTTDCIAEAHPDGTATIYVGTVDYGNGSNTTFAMMAAEVLGLTLESVDVVNADSDRTRNCGSTVATKQTYTTGNAVLRACLPIRQDILTVAGKLLDVPESDIDLEYGEAFSVKNPARRIPVSQAIKAFSRFGKPSRREGMFKAHSFTEPLDPRTGLGKAWFPIAFGTQMAEVDVNIRTGKITVNEITAAHYVGRCINPQAVRGQIVGGISFGWGFALCEDAGYKDGIPQNINFDTYKLMRSTDFPDVRVIAVELDEKSGPFGAIGVGEPPTLAVAPAVANAVYDAIGCRISDLPLLPEKVLRHLSSAPERNEASFEPRLSCSKSP